jgi:hypothetical protein
MRRLMFVGGAAAVVIAAACSDSSTAPKEASTNQWSGAVIQVAGTNPNARGELRGVVLDSESVVNVSTSKPMAGVTVVLNLKVTVPPGTPNDTATTTVTKVGQVVTDAQGRFLVTSIPEGDYYLAATSPDQSHYDNATWAFVSSGSAQADAVIYLPHKVASTPIDSLPGTGHPTNPNPPIDSVTTPPDTLPAPPPAPPAPPTTPVDSM